MTLVILKELEVCCLELFLINNKPLEDLFWCALWAELFGHF